MTVFTRHKTLPTIGALTLILGAGVATCGAALPALANDTTAGGNTSAAGNTTGPGITSCPEIEITATDITETTATVHFTPGAPTQWTGFEFIVGAEDIPLPERATVEERQAEYVIPIGPYYPGSQLHLMVIGNCSEFSEWSLSSTELYLLGGSEAASYTDAAYQAQASSGASASAAANAAVAAGGDATAEGADESSSGTDSNTDISSDAGDTSTAEGTATGWDGSSDAASSETAALGTTAGTTTAATSTSTQITPTANTQTRAQLAHTGTDLAPAAVTTGAALAAVGGLILFAAARRRPTTK